MAAVAHPLVDEFALSATVRRHVARLRAPANDNPLAEAASADGVPGESTRPARGIGASIDGGALASFLAAGAVLFASLVIGSSGSLLLTGSDAMITAIEQAFLSLGLRAVAAGLVALAACLLLTRGWRRARD